MCPAGDILAGPVAETLPVLNWLRLKGPYRLSSTIGPSGLGTPPLRSRLTANFAADLIGLSALKTTWASQVTGSTAKTPLFTGEGYRSEERHVGLAGDRIDSEDAAVHRRGV